MNEENPFEMCTRMFYAQNQEQLEAAMWGRPLRNREHRLYGKQMALEQIERFNNADEIGYKVVAHIQLGIIQMGLGEGWDDAGYSILNGIDSSLSGDEYDIINAAMMGGCLLAYWTNKADKEAIFRCGLQLRFFQNKITAISEIANESILDALALTRTWLMVFSLVWFQIMNMDGKGSISRHSIIFESGIDAARTIDRFSRNQLSVYNWVMSCIKIRD